MPFFNGFPYSDYDQINLDWVIKTCKDALDKALEAMGVAADTKTFVEDYFANLDVQEEINNKIDQMADDGDLLNILLPTISDLVNTWLTANISNPSNPPLDATLSLSAAAAQSSAVGDVIYESRTRTNLTPKIMCYIGQSHISHDYDLQPYTITYGSGSVIIPKLTDFSDTLSSGDTYILECYALTSTGSKRLILSNYANTDVWAGVNPSNDPTHVTWVKVREPFTTDTTLSQAGMAADAQVVGDAIYGTRNRPNMTPKIVCYIGQSHISHDYDLQPYTITYGSGSVIIPKLTDFSDTLSSGDTYILECYALTSTGSKRLILSNYANTNVWAGVNPSNDPTHVTWVKVREPFTTDTTLTVSGKAADGQATGNMIYETSPLTIGTLEQWEIGSISHGNGTNIASTSRIRTITYIDTNLLRIRSINMQFSVEVYDRSGTFRGNWHGLADGLVIGSTVWMTDVNIVDLQRSIAATYPNCLIRIIARWPDNSTTSLADAANIEATYFDVPYGSIGTYDRFGVVGASYDCGYWAGHGADYNHSWPHVLCAKYGTTMANYAFAGAKANTFVQGTGAYSLAGLLADTPADLYVCTLGGNDATWFRTYPSDSYKLGSLADITSYSDPNLYPISFYGCYGKIIEAIQGLNPHARIVLTTPSSAGYTAQQVQVDNAIAEIAGYYGLPLIVWESDGYMRSAAYCNHMYSSHPSPFVYSGMAEAFDRLFAKCSREYFSYFNVLPA